MLSFKVTSDGSGSRCRWIVTACRSIVFYFYIFIFFESVGFNIDIVLDLNTVADASAECVAAVRPNSARLFVLAAGAEISVLG